VIARPEVFGRESQEDTEENRQAAHRRSPFSGASVRAFGSLPLRSLPARRGFAFPGWLLDRLPKRLASVFVPG
jgi:hypothetical protein